MIYLAYGSNLNMQQMRYRCPNATVIGKAFLTGYELLFRGSKTGSYLTIEKNKNRSVPVGVWMITGQDEQNLDRYEGFPTFYHKETIRFSMNGTKYSGIAYIMNNDRPFGIPSTRYIKTCLEGYEDFGFDYEPLLKAVLNSKKHAGKVVK